ncbi:hypothetical protein [Microcystis phage Mae-JY35]
MIERLASLGFTNAEVLNSDGPKSTVRIRTSKGWVYERFTKDNLDAIDLWASRHEPETA